MASLYTHPCKIDDILAQALAFHHAGSIDAAITAYRQVLTIVPNSTTVLTNLGSLLRQKGQLEEAISLLEQALAAPNSNESAAYNLGNAYRAAGRSAEAVTAYRHAIARKPDWPLAYCNLAVAMMDVGDIEAASVALRQALILDPAHELARQNLARIISRRLMDLQYKTEPEWVLRSLATEYGQFLPPPEDLPVRYPKSDDFAVPLRVGFLSPDLCEHPVGFFLRPLLEQLDRQRISPLLYSSGGRDDSIRMVLRRLAQWCDVSLLNDADLLERLRADNLDVLIDLSGHTAGHRLPIFARRAAPLQISWLGYFATTGVPAMDAVLMDAWHVPKSEEGHFSERVIRLPYCRFCYKPASYAPAIFPPPYDRNGYITFGSFNNTAKYHDGVFDLWARVLQQLPTARLILKWHSFENLAFREQTWEAFHARHVDPQRIELRPFSFHRDLLAEYGDIDIALDPFPFTGGHTSCEALWMGVPVITWPGRRPVSRQTLSFIANLGNDAWLEDWVAQDGDDYVQKAVRLAEAPDQLRSIRWKLCSTMQASPLLDGARFARDFAAALEEALRCIADRGRAV